MRTVQTGHGASQTALTTAGIADHRSLLLDSISERNLFRDWFARYRELASRLWATPTGPLEIEALGHVAREQGSVQEAAFIEALASLRAEGVRL